MNANQQVVQWVLNAAQTEYKDDIALVISHTPLMIDESQNVISYFVPVTDKGRRFSRTFILDGIGFDIWGIEWERMERFASLDEYVLGCLGDGEILYARTPEDAARFQALKETMRKNLNDPRYSRKCALESYARAKELFAQLLFAKGGNQRLCAGYVLDFLSRAIAFTNHTWLRRCQVDQVAELSAMANVPEGFLSRYPQILTEQNPEIRLKRCYELVQIVEDFLSDCPSETTDPVEKNFQDLADWYAELAYTWLRIRHYAAARDLTKTHQWGIYLQDELNQVCEDFGLPAMDLMSAFHPNDLPGFAAHADGLEQQMRQHITENGGVIREYATFEEFLHEV